MEKPFAFMTETDKCILENQGNQICLTFKNGEDTDVNITLNTGEFLKLESVLNIIYIVEKEKYELYGLNIFMEIKADNSIPYISYDEENNCFNMIFKKLEEGPFPKYRTEIINNEITTYMIPAQLVDEMPILKSKLSYESLLQHNKITSSLSSVFYNVYKDYYTSEPVNYYLYIDDSIYKITNFGINVLYLESVILYENESIEHKILPYITLIEKKGYIFSEEESLVYHEFIIRDGRIVTDNISNIDSIYKPGNELYESSIYTINSSIEQLNSVLDVIVNQENIDEKQIEYYTDYANKVISDIREKIDLVNKSEQCDKLGISKILIPFRGNILLYSYNTFNDFCNELESKLKEITNNNNDLLENMKVEDIMK